MSPEPGLQAAAAEAASSYDGGGVASRSCSEFGPGDYECDLSTTSGANLRIYVMIAESGAYAWEFAGG